MRHFQPDYTHTAAVTIKSLFYSFGNGPGKEQHFFQVFLRQIEKVIYFLFRNNQYMSFS